VLTEDQRTRFIALARKRDDHTPSLLHQLVR
jgi:hypothetical protein